MRVVRRILPEEVQSRLKSALDLRLGKLGMSALERLSKSSWGCTRDLAAMQPYLCLSDYPQAPKHSGALNVR